MRLMERSLPVGAAIYRRSGKLTAHVEEARVVPHYILFKFAGPLGVQLLSN